MAAMLKFALVLFVFLFVESCKSEDFVIGDTNGTIAYTKKVKMDSLVFRGRTKNVFYKGTQVIKAISAIDLAKKQNTVIVTAGGVGFEFVNVRLKSKRGEELNFVVHIIV